MARPRNDTEHSSAVDSPDGVDGFQVFMLALVILAVACTCLLISAGQGTEVGHQPWKPNSVLRLLTTLMTLSYAYPTLTGVEIKWLVQGVAAAAAVFAAMLGWWMRSRREEPFASPGAAQESAQRAAQGAAHAVSGLPPRAGESSAGVASATTALPAIAPLRRGPGPVEIAQFAMLALAGWMLLSSRWAIWPEAAAGEGWRFVILALWALAVGRSLNVLMARRAAVGLIAVLAVTAAIGIWYFYERAPYQRLKFPIGNPTFLAACLIPGLALGLAILWQRIVQVIRPPAPTEPATASPELSKYDERSISRGTEPATVSPDRSNRRYSLYKIVSLVLLLSALVLLGWAFRLSDARGAMLGLLGGLAVAGVTALRGRWRQGALLTLLAGLVVVVVYVNSAGSPDFVARRMDTFRFRFYAWSYAIDLFRQAPLAGHGQGGYVLLAHALSRPDAELDPGAFQGHLLGHAHNEWLEILADLGVVGGLLALLWLGATGWAAARAAERARDARTRWIALGLLAAFAGIAISELAGVGLRRPGLPLVFATVVGLIWAMAADAPAGMHRPTGRWRRGVALAAGAIVAAWVLILAGRDWHGALAGKQADELLSNRRWDQAEATWVQALAAQQHRLELEGMLSGGFLACLTGYEAALHKYEQLGQMIGRVRQVDALSAHQRTLVVEDISRFNLYLTWCMQSGQHLLSRMPAYPKVAGLMANGLLWRQQVAVLEQDLGLTDKVEDYHAAVRHLMSLEYAGDRLNPRVGLDLLALSADAPLADRADLIRLPLRRGPQGSAEIGQLGGYAVDLFGGSQVALSELMLDKDWPAYAERLAAAARAALADPATAAWPDPYLPETCRLLGRADQLDRRFASAAEWADRAVAASALLRERFPMVPVYAWLDAALYRLLGDPEHPDRAIEACTAALAAWPDGQYPESAQRVGIFLAWLMLASDEAAARDQLTRVAPPPTEQALDEAIGLGLAELGRVLVQAHAPADRPAWLADRLARAEQLVPQAYLLHLLFARLALERQDDPAAIARLEQAEQFAPDAQSMVLGLQGLYADFPESAGLNAFIRDRLGSPSTTTAPESLPADLPDGEPMLPPEVLDSLHTGEAP